MKQFKGIRFSNYVLSADQYQFILHEVATNSDTESLNHGKEYLRNATYHTTLQQAASKIVKMQVLLGVQEQTSLAELIWLMDKQGKELEHNLLRVINANQE